MPDKIRIHAKVVKTSFEHITGIEYYFEGVYIGYSSSFSNISISFTDSIHNFCKSKGITPPKKR